MNSRNAILEAIRRNKPEAVPLPKLTAAAPAPDLAAAFAATLHEIGGRAVEADPAEPLPAVLERLYPAAVTVCSAVPGQLPGNFALEPGGDPHRFADVDLFVCAGTFGVAENGAVWLRESQLVHRAAPFLAQHVALVLDRREVVATMHDAYRRLQIDEEGFGLFMAGPSKTADIEQALVIGAHGPRSLSVLLVSNEAPAPG